MQKTSFFSSLLTIMLLGILLPLPIPQITHAQESTQGVAPPMGPAGTEFAFFAVGFDDKEKLGYWFHAPDGTLYRDDQAYRIHAFQGRVDWKWRVPHNAAPGTWTAVIQGIKSKQQAVITFEVIVYDPAAATQTDDPLVSVLDQNVSPSKGIPGTEFAFYAYGYNEREQVAYWFTAPDGNTITTPENIIHSKDGRVDITWLSPYDAKPGTWTASIKGRESGVQRVLYFDIYLPEGVAPIVTDTDEHARSIEKAVVPQVGVAGSEFAFFARGFDDREKVGYWFNAPDGSIVENRYLFVVIANGDRADWKWQSPENAMPGIWTAVAKGDKSHTERLITFEIGDPSNPTIGGMAPLSPTTNDTDVAVEPVEGPPGTRFAFKASGFPGGETITFWATDSQGNHYENDKYVIKSNEEGIAYWNWRTPDDAIQGTWTMVARGQTAPVQKVIHFEIRDPNAPQGSRTTISSPAELPELPRGTNSPFVSLEPIIAPPGSRFNFSAEGFPHRATVFFWAIDPNGVIYDSEKYHIRANEEGIAYWNWKTPEEGAVGIWEMHAKHNISDFKHIIYFELGDPTVALPQVSFYNPQPAAQPVASQPAQPIAALPTTQQPVVLPENSPNVALDPTAAPPGSRFAFKATGYPVREKVTFWVVAPDGQQFVNSKFTIMSDETGTAYWNWKTPEDGLPGIWQMHALGDKSQLEYTIYFQVIDPSAPAGNTPSANVPDQPAPEQTVALPTNSPGVAVDPPYAALGSRFAFKAAGYPVREKVSFWAIDPNGQEFRNSKYEVKSDEQGIAYWNWKTPDDATPGIWQMHALGDSVALEHTIYFQVLDPTAPGGTLPMPLPQQPGASNGALPSTTNTDTTTQSAIPHVNSPDVAVDPPVGIPGARFAFKAMGYPAREKVFFWAVAPDGQEYRNSKYEVKSDDEGVAYWNWKTPEDGMPGIWFMHALGDKSLLEHVIVFELSGDGTPTIVPQPAPAQQSASPQPTVPPPAAPSSSSLAVVDPLAGSPGTRFAFKAGGFPPREQVSFWAVAPDGQEYRKHKYVVKSDESGVAYWNWQTPEDGAPGKWHMYAQGDKSLVLHAIPFELYP